MTIMLTTLATEAGWQHVPDSKSSVILPSALWQPMHSFLRWKCPKNYKMNSSFRKLAHALTRQATSQTPIHHPLCKYIEIERFIKNPTELSQEHPQLLNSQSMWTEGILLVSRRMEHTGPQSSALLLGLELQPFMGMLGGSNSCMMSTVLLLNLFLP